MAKVAVTGGANKGMAASCPAGRLVLPALPDPRILGPVVHRLAIPVGYRLPGVA
jgi:hypothetical protein